MSVIRDFKDELQKRIGKLYQRKQEVDALTSRSKARNSGEYDAESLTIKAMTFHGVLQNLNIQGCMEVKSRESMYKTLLSAERELLTEFEDIYYSCSAEIPPNILIEYAMNTLVHSVSRPIMISNQGDIRELDHLNLDKDSITEIKKYLQQVLEKHAFLLFIFYISTTRPQLTLGIQATNGGGNGST